MKKIGIIGSGIVGQTLSKGFIAHDFEVMLGSQNQEKRNNLRNDIDGLLTGDFDQTASFAETLVLAVKGNAAESVLDSIDDKHLDGKLVMDTTNPIADEAPENGVLRFFTGPNESLMERFQEKYPTTHFVKVFSCVGSAHMVHPDFKEGKPSMFIAGNSDEAKTKVAEILTAFNWDIQDMGKVEAARAIEPLCMLWCIPGFLKNEWNHAFRLLVK